MLEGAVCLYTGTWYEGLTGDRLIDSEGFFKLTHTLEPETNPALTYRMTNVQTVRTVFVANREIDKPAKWKLE